MPSTSAKAFADAIRARDWNRVLSPGLFGENGLADLKALIEAHGREAVDLAVRDLLARSKADRAMRRGHVRSWHFFRPYLNEQLKRL